MGKRRLRLRCQIESLISHIRLILIKTVSTTIGAYIGILVDNGSANQAYFVLRRIIHDGVGHLHTIWIHKKGNEKRKRNEGVGLTDALVP